MGGDETLTQALLDLSQQLRERGNAEVGKGVLSWLFHALGVRAPARTTSCHMSLQMRYASCMAHIHDAIYKMLLAHPDSPLKNVPL